MKRTLPLLLCLCLLLSGAFALADETLPGGYAESREALARAEGLEIRRETTFEWDGLSLWTEKQNQAMKSLAKVFMARTRVQGSEGNGYRMAELFLSDVSVLDMAVMASGGVLYEQGSLSGGVATAFTKTEFATFMRMLVQRSGALPADLSLLYDAVMMWLGGTDGPPEGADTLSQALSALDMWKMAAMEVTEQRRPKVYLPGIYGVTARVSEVTREEALWLAQALAPLLGEAREFRREFTPAPESNDVMKTVAEWTRAITDLPGAVAEWLPADTHPFVYREVLGPDGALVCRQIEGEIPGTARLMVEWRGTPGDGGLYLYYRAGTTAVSVLASVTGENGGKADRTVVELRLIGQPVSANVMLTQRRTIETKSGKETVRTRTDIQFESDALLGAGETVMLTADTTDTASGTGRQYTRDVKTVLSLGGLVYPAETPLTLRTRTTVEKSTPPINLMDNIIHPTRLDEGAFDAWLSTVNGGAAQAWFTILGRLPMETAACLLEEMQAGEVSP